MRAYLWLVACAAIGCQLYWLWAWRGDLPRASDLGLLLFLLLMAVVAQHFPVAIGPKRKVDVSVAPYFASLVLFGAPVAVAVTGAGQLVGQLTLIARRNRETGKRLRTLRGALFNSSQAMVAVALAAGVYFAFVPRLLPSEPNDPRALWALVGAASAMYLCNTFAVAIMVGLQQRTSPLRVWMGGRRRTLSEFAGLFLVGAVIARAGARDPALVVAMTLPAVIIYWSMNRMVRLEELARRDAQFAAWRDLERLKTEFVRSVSHELRTPLTLVAGFSELLERHATNENGDPEIAELSAQIGANAQLLSRLVDDLVDFSRVERGELSIEPEDFDLVPVLRELLAGLRLQPDGARLSLALPGRLPVRADPSRVAQSVYNLIVNAQKYAPDGPIVVRATQEQSRGSGPPDVVRIEVEDRGPGIPEEEQVRVWEKFYRGQAVSGVHGVRGTGVGLALVKAFVEAQGGRVGLESTPGRGARFWLELPAAEPTASLGRTTHPTRHVLFPRARVDSGPAPT